PASAKRPNHLIVSPALPPSKPVPRPLHVNVCVRLPHDRARSHAHDNLTPQSKPSCLSPATDSYVVACIRPRINLPRPSNLLVWIRQHLLPLRQPPRRPRNSKQHG